MKKLLALLLALTVLLTLVACNKKPAPADVPDDAADKAETPEEPVAPEEPVTPEEAEAPENNAGLISPIAEYLADCQMTEELVFPGGADGAVVQDGQLHFNPHGADKADWFAQMDAVIQMVSDDGTASGTVESGATAVIGGSTFTFTCAAPSDDDWYIAIGKA